MYDPRYFTGGTPLKQPFFTGGTPLKQSLGGFQPPPPWQRAGIFTGGTPLQQPTGGRRGQGLGPMDYLAAILGRYMR